MQEMKMKNLARMPNFKRLTHKSRISMVFRCLKNYYKGKMDFAGPQYKAWYSSIFFHWYKPFIVFFHNSLNQHVKIELLIANLKISWPSKFLLMCFFHPWYFKLHSIILAQKRSHDSQLQRVYYFSFESLFYPIFRHLKVCPLKRVWHLC